MYRIQSLRNTSDPLAADCQSLNVNFQDDYLKIKGNVFFSTLTLLQSTYPYATQDDW